MAEETKSMACRAIWRVNNTDVQLARQQICSKRLQLDDVIAGIEGVEFFFSSITSLANNAHQPNNDEDEDGDVRPEGYPGVAYFIVYLPNSVCNDKTVFGAMHNADMEASVTVINTRAKNAKDCASRQLMQVLKDHRNTMVTAMVTASNTYCYAHAVESGSSGQSAGRPVDAPAQPRHFPKSPCALVVVKEHEFFARFPDAYANLLSDGLLCELVVNASDDPPSLPTCPSDLTTTLRHIDSLMRSCEHALYRGNVYAQPDGAVMAFVKLTDVQSYLNRLLTNDGLRERVLKHSASLGRIMSHPACSIIAQLSFDNDLIEVSNGWAFKVSTRRFVRRPLPTEQYRKVSPRTFVPYDCATEPHGGYFRSGICNSFTDRATRVNFLNKFYQCLVASQMPLKVRKLVVAGPKDSGKTSWACILQRIIPAHFIASITCEAQFSASMIDDATQLVLVDDWSPSTMDSGLAKTLLQGGWMVTAVKHQSPRCVVNNSPFYITTNQVPDFANENENVRRRLAIFQTQSLPETIVGADKWMFDNAMECVAWIAQEVNEGIEMVERHERWYEHVRTDEMTPLTTASTTRAFQSIAAVRSSQLTHDRHPPLAVTSLPTIHHAFELEAERQSRSNRRAERTTVVSSSSDEECVARLHTPSPARERPAIIVATDQEDSQAAEQPNPARRLQNIATSDEENVENENVEIFQWSQPPSQWNINDAAYLKRVYQFIRTRFFNRKMSGVNTLSFSARLRNAERMERDFWTKADPNIDAWMLIIGKVRDAFDLKSFVRAYPDVDDRLQRLRESVGCRIFTSTCPVVMAKNQQSTSVEKREISAHTDASTLIVKRQRKRR